ncbi:hypothetical protein A0128_09195 [Leptospira tipperaryensis]|uniref:Uncharacterized protein n=1 Tax=Leptospira tipperaryensis TaxID=2564040 RepID=A0A1D7UWQ2_9LEPT|nr:hypothetical protein A0128_09195 [Leptospira tipperaryensis]
MFYRENSFSGRFLFGASFFRQSDSTKKHLKSDFKSVRDRIRGRPFVSKNRIFKIRISKSEKQMTI